MGGSEIRRILALVAPLMVLAAACSGESATTSALPQATDPTDSPAAAPTSIAGGLSPAEVFALVSPSLAFVETSASSGSGVMLGGGKVLTNAHVIWPYRTARVVFPDGTEVSKAPLVAVDWMADLAIVDVAHATGLPQPARLGDGEDFAVGSELYLIGYPAETDPFPQPTFTRGILSRFRTWEALDVTYLQSDAVIEGGQSGGALVSNSGEVIGLSGFSFGEDFALAASMTDLRPRIEAMLAGEDVAALGDRRVAGGASGSQQLTVDLPHFLAEEAYVFRPQAGDIFEVSVTSAGDALVAVYAADGVLELLVDEDVTGTESGTFEVTVAAPHFVVVASGSLEPITVELEASVPLVYQADPDDGRTVSVGDTYTGMVDYPGDSDWFWVELAAGQRIELAVDSPNFDATVYVDVPDNPDELLMWDDDSGGGLFGLNPAGSFTAPEPGMYLVGVREIFYDDGGAAYNGGYILTIDG